MIFTPDTDNPDTMKPVGRIISKKDGACLVSSGEIYYDYTLWPDSCAEELHKVLTERARLKKAYTDSLTLIFELRNKVGWGEYK